MQDSPSRLNNELLQIAEVCMEYTNRRGHRYYVLQGKTKTGKPKYYCSKKPAENIVEVLPEELEIREDPASALVTIRRIRASILLPIERQLLEQLGRELCSVSVIVDVVEDSFVIYSCDVTPVDAERTTSMFGVPMGMQAPGKEFLIQHASYTAMLRFSLINQNERLFSAERWCFRGSIDRWMPLVYDRPLEALARKYLPDVGDDRFFEHY